MKTCTLCQLAKPLDSYYVARRKGKECIYSRCKDCTNAYMRKRNASPSARAAIAARYRAKRAGGWLPAKPAMTPERKAKQLEALRRWRSLHRDHFQGLDRMYARLKRARATKAAWPLIVQHYGSACLCCGGAADARDHVAPLKPGAHELNQLTNLQPLCRSCNAQKRGSSLDYRPDHGAWIAELVRINPGLVIDHRIKRGGRAKALGTLVLPD